MKSNFDEFADSYETLHAKSIKLSGYAPSFFDEHKIKIVHREIKNEFLDLSQRTFLNFGCGIGKSEIYIREYFPKVKIFSADISLESIRTAQQRNADIEGISYIHYTKIEELQQGVKYDIIFVANVFHHIASTEHTAVLTTLKSLLKEGGHLFIFEHNPINPLTRMAFEKCEFDVGCTMLNHHYLGRMLDKSGFKSKKVNFVLFFPKILSVFNYFEKYLSVIPLGAQYYFKAK